MDEEWRYAFRDPVSSPSPGEPAAPSPRASETRVAAGGFLAVPGRNTPQIAVISIRFRFSRIRIPLVAEKSAGIKGTRFAAVAAAPPLMPG